MAHEIETHTQAAAAFARKDAWHRLGRVDHNGWSRPDGTRSASYA